MTLIVYHPHAQRMPRIVPTSTLGVETSLSEDTDVPVDDDGYPAWAPFPSLIAFKQAELFINHDFSDPVINAQLEVDREISRDPDAMFKNAREMHKLLLQSAVDDDLTKVRF